MEGARMVNAFIADGSLLLVDYSLTRWNMDILRASIETKATAGDFLIQNGPDTTLH